jgi:dihydrofolate reductase
MTFPPTSPRISLIVAMSENRVIGRKNQLPWHMPGDLKHFKQLTSGHWVAMGRKTLDSIGKPLPNRTNVVITRQGAYTAPTGVLVAHGLNEAISLAAEAAQDELFILGGAEIFAQALPRAGRIHLTLIHANIDGDTYFPAFEGREWILAHDERHEADEKNPFAYSFQRYERR